MAQDAQGPGSRCLPHSWKVLWAYLQLYSLGNSFQSLPSLLFRFLHLSVEGGEGVMDTEAVSALGSMTCHVSGSLKLVPMGHLFEKLKRMLLVVAHRAE